MEGAVVVRRVVSLIVFDDVVHDVTTVTGNEAMSENNETTTNWKKFIVTICRSVVGRLSYAQETTMQKAYQTGFVDFVICLQKTK